MSLANECLVKKSYSGPKRVAASIGGNCVGGVTVDRSLGRLGQGPGFGFERNCQRMGGTCSGRAYLHDICFAEPNLKHISTILRVDYDFSLRTELSNTKSEHASEYVP
jgi:hypothetical protein